MKSNDYLKTLEELRSIAQLGLNYTADEYDKVRFTRILEMVSAEYERLFQVDPKSVENIFKNELGHVTPKIGVNAALFNDKNELFVTRRGDDNLWELPGGWTEMNESPRTALKRELKEEVDINLEVGEVIEIFHRLPGDFGSPHTSYHVVFRCSSDLKNLKVSREVLEYRFITDDSELPWHRDHQEWVKKALKSVNLKTT